MPETALGTRGLHEHLQGAEGGPEEEVPETALGTRGLHEHLQGAEGDPE